MLAVTESAIDAIRQLAPGEAGVRVFTSELPGGPGQETLQVEVAQEPSAEDQVLDVEGAHVFLEPTAATLLEDKVLDATLEGTSVRFAIAEQS
jgi:iron-sulfur cluster assembly protein